MGLRDTYRREVVFRGEPRKAILRSACRTMALCFVFLATVYGARWWLGEEPVFSVGPLGGVVGILLVWFARLYRTLENGFREFEGRMEKPGQTDGGERTA
jgi:hypothetical protein